MATENRLIDAYKIAQDVRENNKENFFQTDWSSKRVCELLESAPTVDAVEVVRCRDCKHYMTIHCTCDGCCISDDWYCADGERRTDHV